MQSCYLAGLGTVDKVNILREGTDGAEMKVVPINPVVVELVKERYCFIASRDVLFEDRETADIEAERLRIEEAETKRRRRKEIQQMINSMDSQGTNGDDTQPQSQPPNLVLVGAPPQEEVIIEVTEPQRVIDVEPEVESETPNLDLNAVGSTNPANPATFLMNIQRVIGDETLNLEDVAARLKAVNLLPAFNDPVHYIRYQLSGNRSLFERPDRGSVCLAEDNPYRAQHWSPEEVPAKKKVAKKKVAKKTKAEAKPLPTNTVKKKPVKPVAKKPVAPLVINPIYLTWLGNPMNQKVEDEAKFSDPTIKLLEQRKGDTWSCSILLTGSVQEFVGESTRRSLARHKAEKVMTDFTNRLNIQVHRAHHPEEND
jgi:hypothetical protein